MKKRSGYSPDSHTLTDLINAYFKHIEGEYHTETTPAKKDGAPTRTRVCDREPEPATISGLAFHLGFNSRAEFDDYEENGKHAALIKRARLQVEAAYEKKLHYQSPTGAIFALKSIGWNEKTESVSGSAVKIKNLKVKVIESGPTPASDEKNVSL